MNRRQFRNNTVFMRRRNNNASGHEPTLPTIRMVEEVLKKKQFLSSKNQLFHTLPKQVMQQTLTRILNYLEESDKVIFNKDGSIIWIFGNSRKARKAVDGSKRFSKLT